jgi:GTP 3',8-cyclase
MRVLSIRILFVYALLLVHPTRMQNIALGQSPTANTEHTSRPQGRGARFQSGQRHKLVPVDRNAPSETALKYAFADGAPGEIGIIAPVTMTFCGECSRLRLTADGNLRTCLFSMVDHNLRALLRRVETRDQIAQFMIDTVLKKRAGHRINEPDFIPPRTMSFIGG